MKERRESLEAFTVAGQPVGGAEAACRLWEGYSDSVVEVVGFSGLSGVIGGSDRCHGCEGTR